MKFKKLLAILPATFLMACGGSEEGTINSENEGSSGEFHTSFGECTANGSSIALTQDSFDESYLSALKGSENLDWLSFKHSNAELTESHDNLYIKFTNNSEILNSALGSFGPTDRSLTITLRNNEGELEAGEYTEEDIKIKLTLGQKDSEGSKTSDIGSNLMTNSIVINDLSEKHVCGTYALTAENGQELISASFDMDVKVVKF